MRLVKIMAVNIRAVIFISCFSGSQAEAVTQQINCASGMPFAVHFSAAVGVGRPVKRAFDEARSTLMLASIPEEDIPGRYARGGVFGTAMRVPTTV